MKKLSPSTIRLAVCATVIGTLTLVATAATYTVPVADPFSRGWYDETGFHGLDLSFTDNYFAGREGEQYRNFFIFSLPMLAPGESIASVSLSLFCPSAYPEGAPRGYTSPDPTETYQLFSLDSTSIAALRAGGTGQTGIFTDLGDGTPYSAGTVVAAASQGTDIVIPLNADFLAYATAHLGGDVSLGGAITTFAPVNLNLPEGVFAQTGVSASVGLNQTQLIINTVPEPGSAALLLSGALICLRRKSSRT
jgi:hypothetical protein